MSDRLNEQLSALLDGELSAGEAELLLRRLDRDAELRGTLSRYTLIGDALRVTRLEAAGEAAPVEPLASASDDDVVRLVAPAIQSLLDPTRREA